MKTIGITAAAVLLTASVALLWTAGANHAVLAADAAKPEPARSPVVTRLGLPVRVHTFEDYETEIEKRWWLVGERTRERVPESTSKSVANIYCCRATETKNFDRHMEDQGKAWKAVIFNPVPGPPMGSRTRLDFRYRLRGTSSLRVQIYSLSNNYHRFLTLSDLEQEKWQSATVDMTVARRPDGGGGPLAADERIDDIQFYIPPEADLWIDDIVLYEEAPASEKRPFPARLMFTGWFDTGKQGEEWPGDFAIVEHKKPLTWDAAKSVVNPETDKPWIRLKLRGMRPLGKQTDVRFRYHLVGSERLGVVLVNSKTGKRHAGEIREIKPGQWSEAGVSLPIGDDDLFADELHFLLDRGGELLIDDVLVYEAKP